MSRSYENLANDGKAMQRSIKKEIKTAMRKIATTATNHYKSSFKTQAFAGDNQKWQKRKREDKGRAILTKSGDLRRSIRSHVKDNSIIIESDKKYAEIHNEGGTIVAIAKVAGHIRKTKSGKSIAIKPHTRNINITIPKRQFMGIPGQKPDDTLMKKIEGIMRTAIENTIPK